MEPLNNAWDSLYEAVEQINEMASDEKSKRDFKMDIIKPCVGACCGGDGSDVFPRPYSCYPFEE